MGACNISYLPLVFCIQKQKNHALSYAATALNTLVVCGYFAALGLPWFNKTAGISVLMRLGSTQAVPPQMLLLYSAEACLFAFILIAGFLSLAALATNLLAIAQKPVRYVLVVALPLAALAAGAIGTFVWTGVYLSFDLFPGTSSTLTLKAVIFSPRFFPQYMSGWIVGITTLVLNAIQAAISAANRPK